MRPQKTLIPVKNSVVRLKRGKIKLLEILELNGVGVKAVLSERNFIPFSLLSMAMCL